MNLLNSDIGNIKEDIKEIKTYFQTPTHHKPTIEFK